METLTKSSKKAQHGHRNFTSGTCNLWLNVFRLKKGASQAQIIFLLGKSAQRHGQKTVRISILLQIDGGNVKKIGHPSKLICELLSNCLPSCASRKTWLCGWITGLSWQASDSSERIATQNFQARRRVE